MRMTVIFWPFALFASSDLIEGVQKVNVSRSMTDWCVARVYPIVTSKSGDYH